MIDSDEGDPRTLLTELEKVVERSSILTIQGYFNTNQYLDMSRLYGRMAAKFSFNNGGVS